MLPAADIARKAGGKVVRHARYVIKDRQIQVVKRCADRHRIIADQFANPSGTIGKLCVILRLMDFKGRLAEGIKQRFKAGKCADLDLDFAPVQNDLLF